MSKSKQQQLKSLPTEQKRTFSIVRAEGEDSPINEEARTVEVAFSSNAPYERWYGTEVLEHNKSNVRMDRLRSGAAVLVNHNMDDHVGVVEDARIDGDGKGRARLRFGSGSRASEIFADIKDGIRSLVSVGYRIHNYKYEEGETKKDPDTVRVTDWEPYEISMVAVPADASVGVGRSHEQHQEAPMGDKTKTEGGGTPSIPAQPTQLVDVKAERASARREEQERIRKITALGEEHDCAEEARQHVEEGKSWEDFQDRVLKIIGERNAKIRAAETDKDKTGTVDMEKKELQRYSLMRVFNALADPANVAIQRAAAFEHEVSEAGAEALGIQARGFFIPANVLVVRGPNVRGMAQRAPLDVSTPTLGQETVATDLLAAAFIDVLRNSLHVMQNGATVLDGLVGNVDIPRQTGATAAGWLAAEDADAPEDTPTFDQVPLTPKDVAAYTEITRRLRQQSSIAIEALIQTDLIIAAATAIDHAALYGTGATGQPRGITNQTGVHKDVFAAAGPTFAEVVDMIAQVMTDNALMGSLAWMIEPSGWAHGVTTERFASTGRTIIADGDAGGTSRVGSINGYPVDVTNQVTAGDWFYANWRDLLVGMWGGIEVNLDPYTHSLKGRHRYVMFQTVDTAVRHPESFVWGNDTP